MRGLLGDALRGVHQEAAFQSYEAAMAGGASVTDRALLGDQRHYLPGDLLHKSDAMSMAAGLELRVPFLDRRIMDLAGRFDVALLNQGCGHGKLVARRLLKFYEAPTEIVRGAKRGFNVPVARLLRTSLAPLGERLLRREADAFAPWLRPEAVVKLWDDHIACRHNHGYLVWALLVHRIGMAP